jgi:NAD(P)H dehydrogenase (quinone)
MFSIIGITGRVGGGAASRLLGMGKQVRAVVRDEAKGHVWASKGASFAVADMTDGDGPGTRYSGLRSSLRYVATPIRSLAWIS